MSRTDPADRMSPHDDGLGAALRALPSVEPPSDLWPVLAAARAGSMPRRRARPSRVFAIAASLALVALVPLLLPRGDAPEDVPGTPTAAHVPAASEVGVLRDRSRQLEQWLAVLSEQSPHDAHTLMATAELEDLVGLVDMQLSAARDDAEALPLWRQRVALLEDLAVTRSVPATLAADGAAWHRSTTL
ncbi:hypothetical protein ACQQ2N_01725 [Dokdonella sp. MW10]|uniref:hypothetical protein n=1 Tax=Dokdonella sp. MW10 TaxID=2992926 RepID=UPI003F823EDE